MEEKNTKAMEEKEFKEYLDNNVNLKFFECVRRFKSVLRAFRRGHITNYGYVVPNRPFHNRKNTCKRGKQSRSVNEEKKRAYYELRKFNNRGL